MNKMLSKFISNGRKNLLNTVVKCHHEAKPINSLKRFSSILNKNNNFSYSKNDSKKFIFLNDNYEKKSNLNKSKHISSAKYFSENINKQENLISNNIDKNSSLYFYIKTILENSITNRYNGILLNLNEILEKANHSRSDENFDKIIKELVSIWTEKSPKSSITVTIPKKHIYLTEHFLNNKFYMHHCTKNDITLCLWLNKNMEDKIPKYCHTLIGTGSVIFTKENKLILIREKYSNYNLIKWKFITGLNDPLESIFDTCEREAKEETNLVINYHGVISFGEFYPTIYNTNEICFFNLCSINKREADIRKDIIIDTNELQTVDFFNKDQANDLIQKKEVTVFTEKVLNKILPFWSEVKSLEENIKFMIDNKFVLKPTGYEEEMSNRFKSFKMYN